MSPPKQISLYIQCTLVDRKVNLNILQDTMAYGKLLGIMEFITEMYRGG